MDVIVEKTGRAFVRPGGAMLNTAVSLARAGEAVSLISELGDDRTATFILNFLKANGVETRYVKKYYHRNTALALAFLDEKKKAGYTFYKSYPVHRRLTGPGEFSKQDILLFGSMYALDGKLRNQRRELLLAAKSSGALICYDPNIREAARLEDGKTREALFENFAAAHLIKASDEDLAFIFGKLSPGECLKEIRKVNPAAPLVVTRGAAGVMAFVPEGKIELPAEPVKVVSTVGAGDAFNAGMLFAISRKGRLPDGIRFFRLPEWRSSSARGSCFLPLSALPKTITSGGTSIPDLKAFRCKSGSFLHQNKRNKPFAVGGYPSEIPLRYVWQL